MRHYGIVCPQFWTGRTGRMIRDMAKSTTAGKDVQRVALYLMTCPHANMIGLYYLPMLYVCEEAGIAKRDALQALTELQRLDFSYYDPDSEHVWVKEMARFQVGPSLSEKDGRVLGINRLYQSLPQNPWLSSFFDRYGFAFHLTARREGPPEGGPGGASRPPILICSDPVPVLVQPGDPPVCGNSGQPEPAAVQPERPPETHATPGWIVEEWNQIPGVEPFKGEIKGEMKKRIEAALRERTSKAWWADYFTKVRAIDWLCGRNEEGWAASLYWALGPVNIGKVQAGHFVNRRKPAPNGTSNQRGQHLEATGCNADPAIPCGLHVVSRIGNERRCPWHSHLAKHPELNEDRETFCLFWPTVHEGVRKRLTTAQAWALTSSSKLVTQAG